MTYYIEAGKYRIPYTIVRSRRKTIAIQVKAGPEVVVRAPLYSSVRDVKMFIDLKKSWIIDKYTQALVENREEAITIPSYMTEKWFAGEGRAIFELKVAQRARQMGISYGRITIRDQKTRWGSCSSKGNLNFNRRLLMMPEEILDYVVVHELAHRREMNHSAAFWKIVGTYDPQYKIHVKWLKEHGSRYMRATYE